MRWTKVAGYSAVTSNALLIERTNYKNYSLMQKLSLRKFHIYLFNETLGKTKNYTKNCFPHDQIFKYLNLFLYFWLGDCEN